MLPRVLRHARDASGQCLIECRFEEGKRFAYVPGPVRVRGKLRIEEHRMGQYLVSIFAMTVADCVEVR